MNTLTSGSKDSQKCTAADETQRDLCNSAMLGGLHRAAADCHWEDLYLTKFEGVENSKHLTHSPLVSTYISVRNLLRNTLLRSGTGAGTTGSLHEMCRPWSIGYMRDYLNETNEFKEIRSLILDSEEYSKRAETSGVDTEEDYRKLQLSFQTCPRCNHRVLCTTQLKRNYRKRQTYHDIVNTWLI